MTPDDWIERPGRVIVRRIAQHIAFALKYEACVLHFFFDRFRVDAVQTLRIAQSRTCLRGVIYHEVDSARLQRGEYFLVEYFDIRRAQELVMQVVVVERSPHHVERHGWNECLDLTHSIADVSIA